MGNRRRRLPLELLVFVVGSATLGSEIAVARLIAPFFGDSTIVWANTIAVVLVALSIGYQYARVVEYPDGRRQLELNRRHVACTPTCGRWLADARRLEGPLEGGTVYTDDKAPMEWLVDKSLLEYAGGGR